MPRHAGGVVRRHSRGVRWFHAVTYLTVLVLLGTGWWLTLGHEGEPSPIARLTGQPDPTVHTWSGWVLAGLAGVAATVGFRATRTFLVETVRHDRGDLRWFRRWPAALLTGRFGRHEGHFDPGQRIANVALVGLLLALIGSGVGLLLVTGGPAFVVLRRIHQWATWLITPILLGHVVIASGILPGYRGVARAMHLGGRLPVEVARRVWPGWTESIEAKKTVDAEISDGGPRV
jgi:formate dehydrogenase subunit gamma